MRDVKSRVWSDVRSDSSATHKPIRRVVAARHCRRAQTPSPRSHPTPRGNRVRSERLLLRPPTLLPARTRRATREQGRERRRRPNIDIPRSGHRFQRLFAELLPIRPSQRLVDRRNWRETDSRVGHARAGRGDALARRARLRRRLHALRRPLVRRRRLPGNDGRRRRNGVLRARLSRIPG